MVIEKILLLMNLQVRRRNLKVARMQIAKEQGQFLEIVVKISNAKSCLEIGRFTGLSTLYMARGLPKDGKIVTVDTSDEFLSIAKKYWDRDGQAAKIKSIIGAGTEVMQSFIDRQYQFDIIFIEGIYFQLIFV